MYDPMQEELHYEEMARYDYIRELAAEHTDHNDPDVMDIGDADYPPEQEGVTWERIEYPPHATFVNDPTPDDDVPF